MTDKRIRGSEPPELRVLHLAGWIGPRSTGLGRVSTDLVIAQRRHGIDARLWTIDTPVDFEWALRTSSIDPSVVSNYRQSGLSSLRFSPEMFRQVRGAQGASFDVVHQQSIWTAVSAAANAWRRRTGGPTIIAPQGALAPYARARSRGKKHIAWWLYERLNVQRSACLHATSEAEVHDLRSLGLRQPIAMIPNGVPASWLDSTGNGDSFRERHGIARDRRLMMFLSRITPKKGIPLFLRAMRNVRQHLDDWIFVIAGFEEFGHLAEVRSTIDSLGLGAHVRILGPLYGEEKRDAFDAIEICVLPSLSEGAPMVVLDALGAGVPMLVTSGTSWVEISRERCGWYVDPSEAGLTEALREALVSDAESLRAMGNRGKQLVARDFSWDSVAESTRALYNWLLGRDVVPVSVRLD